MLQFPPRQMETRKTLTVFLFFLALATVFTAPISLAPHERVVNDGDPLHISWILGWVSHQLVRAPLQLFDSNTFYPYGSSLAFSEHMLGIAPLAAPVYYATGNALLAQNIALLLTLALSGTGMYLLVRELVGNGGAGVVAGLVYTFHTYNLHEIPRIQLLSAQWLPLALLYLHRAMTSGKTRDAWLFGLFFMLQGLSTTYYLFYFGLLLAFWVPAYVVAVPGGVKRALGLVAPLGTAGILFGLLAIPYLRMLREFRYERPLTEGLDLLEYVRPPDGSLLASLWTFDIPPSIAPQFLGMGALALAALGLIRWRSMESRPRATRLFFALSVATGLGGLVLSLGPTIRIAGTEWGTGPYRWLYDGVPLFRVFRSAERMSLLVRFSVAVAAGFGVAGLFQGTGRGWLRLARIALLVWLPYEHFTGGQPYTTLPTSASTPEVYRWLRDTPPDGPVVEVPLYPREQLRLHALYNYYSTTHWRPIVFGRTSFYPPLVGYLAWELREFPDSDAIGLLERLGVERVVVHPNLWPPAHRGRNLARLREFADRLVPEAQFARLEGPAYHYYGLGDERAYRLRAGVDERRDPLCEPAEPIPSGAFRLSGDAKTPHEWAFDGDPATVWRTDRQLPGLKLQVDLGREETVSAVTISIAYPHDEFPRDLTLKASRPGERFSRVFYRDDLETKWELVESLVDEPSRAAITLRFDPIRARRLRFWVREGKGFDYALPDWSTPEIRIFRRCEP